MVHVTSVSCVSSQPSVRRTHNTGRKHRDEVRRYYEAWFEAQTGMKTMSKFSWLIRVLCTCACVYVRMSMCVCVCVHVCALVTLVLQSVH